MATPLNTQQIPPVPSAMDLQDGQQKVISQPWQQWFQQVRDKVNVITSSIVALAGNSTAGFLSSNGIGGINSRILTPGTGITITNQDGVLGNPVISATASGGAPINIVNNTTANYTVQVADLPSSSSNVGWVASDVATANYVQVDTHANQAIPVGAHLYVSEEGAGTTTIQAMRGVTFVGSSITGVAKGVGEAVQISTNTWHIFGNLKYQSASYNSAVLADSPLAYWTLGESSGTSAIDSSGNSYTGTYVNAPTLGVASILPTDPGTGVVFNGTTQRIDVGAITPLISLSRTFSVEWWMKPASVTSFQAIYSAGRSGSLGGFLIRINTSGNIEVLQDNVASVFTITAGLVVNTVYYCVFTMDGSGNWKFYLNNVMIGSGTTAATFTGAYVTLAADSNKTFGSTLSSWFSGELEKIAVYGTVLSSTQINNHYLAA